MKAKCKKKKKKQKSKQDFLYQYHVRQTLGFPGGAYGKEPTC